MLSTTQRTTYATRTRSPATNSPRMGTFRSIVLSSIVAGFVVGVIVTVIQHFGTVPLILKAETFERAAETHQSNPAAGASGVISDHNHSAHEHGAEAWEPREGLERDAYTAAANVLTAIGFALILAGLFAVRRGGAGEAMSWHQG